MSTTKTIHWSDELGHAAGEGVFEIRDKPAAAFVPTLPQLPAVSCSPAGCARIAKRSEPLAEQMVERGLSFDRDRLGQLLDEYGDEIAKLDSKLARSCTDKAGAGLVRHYAMGEHDQPFGGIGITHECQLWRAHSYVMPMSEVGAIMSRLRLRRAAALCLNVAAELDTDDRVHSVVFAGSLNGSLRDFDPREIAFADVVRALKGPALVVHLPDLAIRSLAYACGDTTLTELLQADDPWGSLYREAHPQGGGAPTDSQRAEAREITLGTIFGSGLASSNEWFASLHLPHLTELYQQPWFNSLRGCGAWRSQIDRATCDHKMQYSSLYSTPNPERARKERGRLLAENTAVIRRVAALSVGETCEQYSAEPRRSREAGAAHLVAAIGDYYVVEGEVADELGAAIKEKVTALFAENFPALPLAIEIEYL